MSVTLRVGDCREVLKTLEAGSVQTCVTSPPYYGLRAYGVGAESGELGSEPTPEQFIANLIEVFREVKRVLRDDGVLFCNLGDSYSGSGKGGITGPNSIHGYRTTERGERQGFNGRYTKSLPAKNLLMMPFRVAIALQADGWILRSVMPWVKRSAMPESVQDRPASALEYVFLLTKKDRYFWDAEAVRRISTSAHDSRNNADYVPRRERNVGGRTDGYTVAHGAIGWNPAGRSFRNTDLFFDSLGLILNEDDEPLAFDVNPAAYAGAHFATFPVKLVEPMVRAGSSERGACPACGAAWRRDNNRVNGYNSKHDSLVSVSEVLPRSAEGSVRHGSSEDGWTATGVPGVRREPAQGELGSEAGTGTPKGEGISRTECREGDREEAGLQPDGTGQAVHAGTVAGIPEDRTRASASTSPQQASEADGARQDQRAHTVQPSQSTPTQCTGDVHGTGLAADARQSKDPLFLLQDEIHEEATRDDGSRDSAVSGRGTRSREHRGSVPPLQFQEVESVDPAFLNGWAPSCRCRPILPPIPCVVLDCFAGAGTTLLVADRLGRHAIGIELNPEYARMAEDRIRGDAPMFAEITA